MRFSHKYQGLSRIRSLFANCFLFYNSHLKRKYFNLFIHYSNATEEEKNLVF